MRATEMLEGLLRQEKLILEAKEENAKLRSQIDELVKMVAQLKGLVRLREMALMGAAEHVAKLEDALKGQSREAMALPSLKETKKEWGSN